MCELCNGTNTYHRVNEYAVEFMPCPICGPMDPKVKAEKDRIFNERLAAAELKFEMKSA
jgi:translation initiation factor 2 beta subunit (eIF-2beta)/eIF-5